LTARKKTDNLSVGIKSLIKLSKKDYYICTMPNYEKATQAASDLLQKFGYAAPPINPARISEELGVGVVFAEFPEKFKNVSGFYDPSEDSIFVNSAEHPRRQTFTIAHELGHSILHKEWAMSAEYKVLLRDQDLAVKDPIEQEANAFAAHLLVPRDMLDKYRRVASVEELSNLFAVSMPVIRNRLKFEFRI
jgi:Zn-dependent peptidase ImmA (M78 family)